MSGMDGSAITVSRSCLIELTKDIGNYSTIGKVRRGPAKKYLIQVVWQSNDVLYIKSSLNHVIFIPDVTEEEVAPELPISVPHDSTCVSSPEHFQSDHEVDTPWSSDSSSVSGETTSMLLKVAWFPSIIPLVYIIHHLSTVFARCHSNLSTVSFRFSPFVRLVAFFGAYIDTPILSLLHRNLFVFLRVMKLTVQSKRCGMIVIMKTLQSSHQIIQLQLERRAVW